MASGSPSKSPANPVSVLFVCLGNICRSTMAEGVFRNITDFGKASQHQLISDIDSCGTGGYHIGDRPDQRTLSVLADNGLTDYKHKARKIKVPDDFERFSYVIAMDQDNFIDLQDMAKRAVKKGQLHATALEKIHLYGEFGAKNPKEEIGDPYYGGRDGFEIAYEQVVRCGNGLLKHIEELAGKTER